MEHLMGLRSRILKLVHADNGGPRPKTVLEGLARTPVEIEGFERIFKAMLDGRELVMRGKKRGARYGLPKKPKQ
jgi:hypothetical protein